MIDARTGAALAKLGQDLLDRAAQAVELANSKEDGSKEQALFHGNAYAYGQAAEMLAAAIGRLKMGR